LEFSRNLVPGPAQRTPIHHQGGCGGCCIGQHSRLRRRSLPVCLPSQERSAGLLAIAAMAANPTTHDECAKAMARAMGRNNEEKCDSIPCCLYEPNFEECLVRSDLAFCNPWLREGVEENVECSCKIAKATFPCLPNVGCDFWWGIFVACVIITCFIWWWRFRALFRECCTSRNLRGGSQCSQCSNHLSAGAQFCPQCNGRTDALEPIPDLGGGWPGDSEGSLALTGSRLPGIAPSRTAL
jgi:hypothetical protein